MKQVLPANVYRVDPSGRVDLVLPFEQGLGPNGLCFLARLHQALCHPRRPHSCRRCGRATDSPMCARFTDCMVDGIRCGADGMRADKAGNIWASSSAPSGLLRRDGVESGRQTDRPHPSAGRLRQCLLRRPQARSSVQRPPPSRSYMLRTNIQGAYSPHKLTRSHCAARLTGGFSRGLLFLPAKTSAGRNP